MTIERRQLLVRWIAGATLALVVGFAGRTPATFGQRIGPFYVAGFAVTAGRCEPYGDCDPALMDVPTVRRYEVWLFTRPGLVITDRPRVDQLLSLPLQS